MPTKVIIHEESVVDRTQIAMQNLSNKKASSSGYNQEYVTQMLKLHQIFKF